MFDEIVVCLDGSTFAEKAIPLACSITAPKAAKVVLLRVVQDLGEIDEEEAHLRESARRYGAELRVATSLDPVQAIRNELVREPNAIAALTTHGRGPCAEGIMGSVASQVLRQAKRPVLLLGPQERSWKGEDRIATVAVALDGSRFSETIVPYAVKAARWLSARLLLFQALPQVGASTQGLTDILESSYLQRKSAEIRSACKIDPQWEVLHGEAGDAICRYLKDMPETLLAMTTHARAPAQRFVLGSVSAYCVRHAGVPLLLYWPPEQKGSH